MHGACIWSLQVLVEDKATSSESHACVPLSATSWPWKNSDLGQTFAWIIGDSHWPCIIPEAESFRNNVLLYKLAAEIQTRSFRLAGETTDPRRFSVSRNLSVII